MQSYRAKMKRGLMVPKVLSISVKFTKDNFMLWKT